VTFRFDLVEDLPDASLLIDQERRALHAHDLLPIHILLFEDVVRDRRFFVLIRKQNEIEVELLFELRLGTDGVGRNADDQRVFRD
jgi:hypothetical protein